MAELVDAAEATAPTPRLTPALPPDSVRTVSVEDAPTEPATSPRMMEVPVPRWPQELQLPTGMIGPREEPEQFPTRFIINDGRWTQEEHEAVLRKAAQAWNYRDMNREQHDAVLREKEAHEQSIGEWEAKIALQGLKDQSDVPRGPPPKETSSMRALPDVHAALRQNDLSMATGSQPVLKKAPPSTGRPMPKGFYSDKEPPRIGSGPVQPPPPLTPRPREAQPPGVSLPREPTPMTPGHPPRPPVEALPKPMPMESQMTNKHPVESPSQQGPNKQARHKPFPFNEPPPVSTSMTLSPAAEMPRPGAPIPKVPPASFMPTPGDVQQMSSSSPAADPRDRITEEGKYRTILSVTDIDWTRPLHEQLKPNLKGGPRTSTSFDDLCMLRECRQADVQGSPAESISHRSIQSIGIVYSKIVCLVVTPRVKPSTGPTAPRHGIIPINGNMQRNMQISCTESHFQVLFYARNAHFWCVSS